MRRGHATAPALPAGGSDATRTFPPAADGGPYAEGTAHADTAEGDRGAEDSSDETAGVGARQLARQKVEHGLGRLLPGAALGFLGVFFGTRYLWWRLETLPETGWLGIGFYAVEVAHVAAFVLLVPMLVRIRRKGSRPRPQGPPTGTLDVFIPVCGEPVDLVERTLQAALAIEYPHRTYLLNDGRLAGKPNWRDVERLADRYGVECLTRRAGRPGKAGNLNHGLARSDGEFVLAVDADHRVSPDAATQTLGYFADPGIAFVCTPQNFRLEGGDHLHNRELFFYWGIQPARDADGCAFSCGNGVVYRRAALREIGGFSEWNLVEDLHTSYELHAKGWRSVYHRRPLSLGEAPQKPAAFAKQRLTWATDGLRLLLWDSPVVKPGLGLADRLHYLHDTGHYFLTCLHVLFAAGPLLYIFWGQSVMRIDSVAEYAWQIAPFLVAVFATLAAYSGWRGMLGAVQNILFLGPVALVALFRARTLSRRRLFSGVTPKTRQPWFSLLLTPQAVLLAGLTAAVVTVLLSPRRSDLALAGFWAAWMALLLAGPLLTSPRPLARWARAVTRGALVSCMVGFAGLSATAAGAPPPSALLVGGPAGAAMPAEATQGPARAMPVDGRGADDAAVDEGPRGRHGVTAFPCPTDSPRRLGVPERGAYLGAFNERLNHGDRGLARWESRTGVDVAISHWYQHWRSGHSEFQREWLERTRAQGAVPMISWEPWEKPQGSMQDAEQPEMRLARIARGDFDGYVRDWARQAAAYGEPLLLRPMHEMNGRWYPWSVGVNDNSAADFVAAWRYLHEVFEEAGAHNVSWVWSVNTFHGLDTGLDDVEEYYPGGDVVDWVGVSAFNWGSSEWSSWARFEEAHGDTLEDLAAFDKPLMVAEIGTVEQGGDEAVWTNEALKSLASRSAVKAVVWFDRDYPGPPDFRLGHEEADVVERRARATSHWLAEPAVVERNDHAERGDGADRRPRPTCGTG